MREDNIVKFLVELGVDADSIISRNGWVNCPCVLAPYTHGSGEDAHPSFGIRVNDSGPSYYFCFGCMPYGRSLHYLLHNIFIMSGRYPVEAGLFYARHETIRACDVDFVPRTAFEVRKVPETPLPGSVLHKYPLLQISDDGLATEIRTWLQLQRGVPVWIQNYVGLRYWPEQRAVVFPLTNSFGQTYLLRVRRPNTKSIFTVSPALAGFPDLKFPRLKNSGVWFGMGLLDIHSRKPVVLVEAEIDMMRLLSLGLFRVLASTTSSVTNAQLDALSGTLILGYDADVAGRHAHRRITDYLGGRGDVTLKYANWSLARNKDGGPCKDAGDLPHRAALLRVLENLSNDLV